MKPFSILFLVLFVTFAQAQMPPVSGYAGWWRADVGVVTDASGRVQEWQDQSGNGRHFAQSDVNKRPALVSLGIGGQASLRFDGTDDGLLGASGMNFARPSTVFVVFERVDTGDVFRNGGYVLQSSAEPHWFVRSDGFHSGSWVRYGMFPGVGEESLAVMTSSATGTRVHVNGHDWTHDASQVTGAPGRLGLGGGEGHGFDPMSQQIAEVIVYDRELSDGERQEVEAYLAQRYAFPAPPVAVPVISPASQIASAPVNVTMSVSTSGAVIRYTTDGTEPSATSTLYSGAFTVPAGTTVKARAFKTGRPSSGLAHGIYTLGSAMPFPSSGLVLWSRADMGVTTDSSGAVEVWQDLSGAGNHFTQSTPQLQPQVKAGSLGGQTSIAFDGSDDGLQAPAGMNLGRPSTVFMVFEREANDDFYIGNGTVLQNSASPRWVMNTGGFSSGGTTLRNAFPGRNRRSLAVMTNSPSFTRVHVDGADWTHDASATTGAPGRLALGGGSGGELEPVAVRVAEVIAFSDALTDSERDAVEAYLAQRYGLSGVRTAAPVISPVSQIVSGSTTVTMTSATSGAELRYTTDGSEPTATSTLYSGSFSAAAGTTVRARAFKAGRASSAVVDAVYTAAAAAPPVASGLKMWVRADQGLTLDASGAVERWGDRSGHGNDLFQGIPERRPDRQQASFHGQPALQFDGGQDGMLGGGLMDFQRPSTVFVVFERAQSFDFYAEGGYVTQNSAGPHWFIRSDGYHSGDWVRNEEIQRGAETVAVMTNSATGTTVHANGVNVTTTATHTAGVPGRLALGGGEGQAIDPMMQQIAEVIVYDRALDDTERQSVEAYLAARYTTGSGALDLPTFSPPPGSYSGPVSVTASHVTSGVTLRYTTDGSVPTAASAEFSAPLNVTADTLLRVRAFKSGSVDGSTADAFYQIRMEPARTGIWHPSEGGSGHQYEVFAFSSPVTWNQASAIAQSRGGHLATLTSAGENEHVYQLSLLTAGAFTPFAGHGPFVGGYQPVGSVEPAGGWTWVNGEGVFGFTDWISGEPNNGGGDEHHLQLAQRMSGRQALWFDNREAPGGGIFGAFSFVVEHDSATPGQAAPALADVPAGAHDRSITVTLSSSTPSAVVRYTTDGSPPDATSAVYAGPLTFTTATVLRTRASAAGLTDSEVVTYVYDIRPAPLVAEVLFNGSPVRPGDGFTRSGSLSVELVSTESVQKVSFLRQTGTDTPVLIGEDTHFGDGIQVPWSLLSTPDGAMTLIARVYDSQPTPVEVTRAVTVSLAPPIRPVITSPADGTVTTNETITLSGTASADATLALFRNGVEVDGGVVVDVNGSFSLSAALLAGADNIFTLRSTNRGGSSQFSFPVKVTQQPTPPLLSILPAEVTLTEGQSTTITVTLSQAPTSNKTVELNAGTDVELDYPEFVTVLAGQTSASFTLTAVQDTVIEPVKTFTLSATATGVEPATRLLTVNDDDAPALDLLLSLTEVPENAGAGAVTATFTRSPLNAEALTLQIVATGAAGALSVPATVTIPALSPGTQVPLSVIDDALVDGAQTVTLQARLLSANGALLAQSPVRTLSITDDEGPQLSLGFAAAFVREGLGVTATVSRAPVTASAVLVTLTPSPAGQISLPAQVTIPANQASVSFTVTGTDDGVADGAQNITLSASGAGYQNAQAVLAVTDELLPDFTFTSLTHATTAGTEDVLQVTWTLRNAGLLPHAGPVQVRTYLSEDAEPGDDDYVGSFTYDAGMAVNGTFTRTENLRLPRASGDYWVIVVADPADSVEELVESNNTRLSTAPVVCQPAYTAVVSTASTVERMGQPITFTGSATRTAGGPAASSLVDVQIRVRDTSRIVSVLTDAAGAFSHVWTPLPGEAGLYTLGAKHPGEPGDAPVQDQFTLVGFATDEQAVAHRLIVDAPAHLQAISLRNAGDTQLTGVTAQMQNVPAGVTATANVINGTLPGLSSTTVNLSLSVTAAAPETAEMNLRLTSSEGALLDLPVKVTKMPVFSQLAADPVQLSSTALRGQQTIVSLDISNIGSQATGPVSVLMPGSMPWFTPLTAMPAAALASGGEMEISFQIAPPAGTTLGHHTGNLVLRGAQSDLSVPFDIEVTTNVTSSLAVRCEDEGTYYSQGNPLVQNAVVKLLNTQTGSTVASGSSGATGVCTLSGLQPGVYLLDVSAPQHSSSRQTVVIPAGTEMMKTVFLPFTAVTYTWNVLPTKVPDVTKVTLTTTFETNVPKPVVTVEPNLIQLSSNDPPERQVNFTVTNHGLIRADDVKLEFTGSGAWSVEVLSPDLGDLAAKTSIVVPAIIRYNPSAPAPAACCGGGEASASSEGEGEAGEAASSESGGGAVVTSFSSPASSGCPSIYGGASYTYPCGGTQSGAAPVAFSGEPGNCPGFPLFALASGGSLGSNGGAASGYATNVSCSPLPQVGGGPGGDDDDGGLPDHRLHGEYIRPPKFIEWGYLIDLRPKEGRRKRYALDLWALIRFEDEIGLGESIYDDELTLAFGGGTGTPPCCVPGNVVGVSPLVLLEKWNGNTRTVRELYEHLFGDPVWTARVPDQSFFTFMQAFYDRIQPASEEQESLSTAEIAFLQALTPPTGVSPAQVTAFLQRWNRSIAYWEADIGSLAEVPPGDSTDFITFDVLQNLGQDVIDAYDCAELAGYETPFDGFDVTESQVYAFLTEGGGVCARVKLQIDQDAVLSRDAFHASLALNNLSEEPLENVTVFLKVLNPDGTPAGSGRFIIEAPATGGFTGPNVNTLAAGGTGTFDWTLIPTDQAAPTTDTPYLISGTILYVKGGELVTVEVETAAITARPIPELALKYFMQRDVFSDDPHTPAVEPSIPFSLAVMVENTGAGAASDLQIESSQPKIIENEKGLLIDFNILSTEVDGVGQLPGLRADFGTVAAGQRKTGRWLLSSSLHGHFIDYKAEMQHINPKGQERPPLITTTEIHEMIRQVRADRVTDDSQPDFLVNDVPDIADMPDTLHLSTGGTELVSVVLTPGSSTAPAPGQLHVPLTATMPAGWAYLRILDPANGAYQLTGITRSDGKVILMNTNAWVTDRTFIGFGVRPVRENVLHLLDHDSTGSYTLHYASLAAPDTTAPASSVAALPAQSRQGFSVSWSGTDDVAVSRYDIFVSTNGSPYTKWLEGTELTSALFLGTSGQTYAFYSVAIDSSGNAEAAPGLADASTTTSVLNQAPVLDLVPPQVTTEGALFTLQLHADDPDASGPISYALAAGSPAGIFVDPTTGLLTWVSGENDGGVTHTVTVVASDNSFPEGTASRSFTIQVQEQNSAPTIATPMFYTFPERTPISFELPGQDADVPNQTLTWSLTGTVPSGAVLAPALGTVSWTTPSVEDTTEIVFNYTVTDAGSPPLATSGQVILRIVETSTAPVLTLSSTMLDYEEGAPPMPVAADALVTDADSPHLNNGLLTVNLSAGASEGDSLVITPGAIDGAGTVTLAGNAVNVDGTPVGLLNTLSDTSFTLSMGSGATPALITRLLRHVTFVCDSDAPATSPRTLSIMLTDGDNGSSLPATRLIQVIPQEDTPIAGADTHTTIVDASIHLSHLLRNDRDPDGESLTLSLPSGVTTAGGTVTASAGVVTYTPPAGFTGTDTFSYTVTAGPGSATGQVTMRVVPAAEYLFQPTAITPPVAGSLTLEVPDVPNGTYRVEASDDLQSWQNRGNASPDATGTLRFTDGTVAGKDRRFYQFTRL
ncbi:MAG: chitobiase/beta-hexosaminidase C-terminal domain-containing protein [Verrucomicrobiaceae bacterium]|nr:chitobiase/beta-hexosaminidase C-terminal domain-containing protein [Verrucomicrobiaceae bacterium]